MAGINTLNERLTALEAVVDKVSTESSATLAELVLLREQLANTPIPADAEATLTRIEGKVKGIDDLIPDANPT